MIALHPVGGYQRVAVLAPRNGECGAPFDSARGAFLFKLVKALVLFILDRQGFQKRAFAQFSQELVKGKF
ncbi:hypothetical protein A6769_12175 [Nostoc punctiforme NIES-2108]|uniref:Uncharacterized protein n=1 Tax=Nostoc punctiforme NIES-2108 TaxID=1356359 RepID=A0A367RP62_NOSPU|nr:hypothetical protein A6769_12175 [Nostoc punctiforme NIES-2108]